MFPNLRGLTATLLVCTLLVLSAAPASSAEMLSSNRSNDERSVNVVFDAGVLRPLGLVVTIGGALLYGVVAPFVAMTRPSELGKPLEPLVLRPARFTFVDPLGEH